MGRIKSALIKRTARSMIKEENQFKEDFNTNKSLISNSMPSKRLRNRIAGYVTRLKRNDKKRREMLKNEANFNE
jgi:ribosomal protein S17E